MRWQQGWISMASWLVTFGLAAGSAYLKKLGDPGAQLVSLRYLALLFSACVSLVLSTSELPLRQARIVVVLLGYPLMVIASLFTIPAVGYGTQILGFGFWAATVALLGAATLAALIRHSGLSTANPWPKRLILANLSVAVLAFLMPGTFSEVKPVTDRLGPASVQVVDIGPRPSVPLIEGRQAFFVTMKGLFVLDLDAPEVEAQIELPLPSPQSLGMSGEFIEEPGPTGEAMIVKTSETLLEICFRYPFYERNTASYAGGYLHFVVDMASQVVTCCVRKPDGRVQCPPAGEEKVPLGEYLLSSYWFGQYGFIRIEGPGTDESMRLGREGAMLVQAGDVVLGVVRTGRIYVMRIVE